VSAFAGIRIRRFPSPAPRLLRSINGAPRSLSLHCLSAFSVSGSLNCFARDVFPVHSLHCLSAFSVSGSVTRASGVIPAKSKVSIAFRRFPSPALRFVRAQPILAFTRSPLPFGVFRLRLVNLKMKHALYQCV